MEESHLFVNGVKTYRFKAKYSQLIDYLVCLGSSSKDFSDDNIKKTGLNGYVHYPSFNYRSIEVEAIQGIHKSLMKRNNIK